MAFVQIMEFSAADLEAVRALVQEFVETTEGKRTARRSVLLGDRAAPGRYVNVVFFDSYESAMENSNLPEVQSMAGKMSSMVEGLSFRDLDVVDDLEL